MTQRYSRYPVAARVNEVLSLKKGPSDPSDKLVAALKKQVCPFVSESEVDAYLATSFQKASK